MSDKQETIADIVAELRQDYKGRPPMDRAETTWCRRRMADRIEAAHKREIAHFHEVRNVEDSMDWMSFSSKMKQEAYQLSSSVCPMVFVLPDGREIRFSDIEVGMFNYKGKRGDAEYDGIGFRVNLLGAEVRNDKDDSSLARPPCGNGAKMREALDEFCAYSAIVLQTRMFNAEHLERLVEKAKAALAKPPRNCDVGTVEEQCVRYSRFCRQHAPCDNGNCPLRVAYDCKFTWGNMPYEPKEGGEG